MEPEPYLSKIFFSKIIFNPINLGVGIAFAIMILLLVLSALISGSEVAFFSLSPSEKEKIKSRDTISSETVLKLLSIPERLLAAILISNNLINVAIVIISTYITTSLFDFTAAPIAGFVFQIIVVTFLLLVFGEILPKLYSKHNAVRFSLFMSRALLILEKIFWGLGLSWLLTRSSKVVNKLAKNKQNISLDELGEALELTEKDIADDKNILEGIVKFGNIEVRDIMKSRVDVIGVDIKIPYDELNETIIESGYSRIPVFSETFDNIKGILYVKDLLPHLQKNNNFNWQTLIRPAYYVPETKKISGLLKEFQSKKMHLAIVIDEYGGSSGIITLEDVLEEIVGDITDESDFEKEDYTKLDDQNYIFEGKVLLNDFCKILSLDEEIFDEIRGDAETLAGMILEVNGEIPENNQDLKFKNFIFTVKSADDRRIKEIHVHID